MRLAFLTQRLDVFRVQAGAMDGEGYSLVETLVVLRKFAWESMYCRDCVDRSNQIATSS